MLSRLYFQTATTPRLSSTLDLARWVAAVLVIIFHIRVNVLTETPTENSLAVQALYLATNCGKQAVIWFFVLSGFLIGGSVIGDVRRNRFSYGRYAAARISRLHAVLLPALVVGLLLDRTRVMLHGGFMPGEHDSAASHTAYAFFANVLCLQTIVAPTLGSNNPLWSLANEAWYYLLFPLLIAPFMTTRSRWARALLCLTGIAALAFLQFHNPRLVRLFTFWLLGVGVRFCPAPLMRSAGLAWMFAIAGMLAYPAASRYVGDAANVLVALPLANMLLTLQFSDTATELPGARFHAMFAGFSYSLYLVHLPAVHFVLTLVRGQTDPHLNLQPVGWEPWAWGASLFSGALFYAWIFSRLTEAHTARLRGFLSTFFLRWFPVTQAQHSLPSQK